MSKTKKHKQIIAMGGGGFSMEPDNPLLDRYVLGQCPKSNPKVCFIPPGPYADYIARFDSAFTKLPCRPSHLTLFPPPVDDLAKFILEKDIIYVGGGTTKSMLAVWREWGIDKILREAYQRGILLCGVSAGAICWFDWALTDSIPGKLTTLKCLGILPGSCCPHYNGEPDRRPAYQKMIARHKLPAGYAADDGAALHFVDGRLYAVVSSRPAAMAYKVSARNDRAVEQLTRARYLG